jgi:hypothetical protein
VLVGHGFAVKEDGLAESWLAADARPASSGLYLSVGFEPVKHPDVFAGRASAPAS